MYIRTLEKLVLDSQLPGFITMIYGPRRVGKTFLLQEISSKYPQEALFWFNGDTKEVQNTLGTTSEIILRHAVEKYQTVIIDEAQRIPDIALALKILIDIFPEKRFFVTGSSSLALARGAKETLAGRVQQYKLYPLSTLELGNNLADFQYSSLLPGQLIYGGYPYVWQLSMDTEKRTYLEALVEQHLFEDILFLKDLHAPEVLRKLATLLAFQIGYEVSYNELSRTLGIDVKTVQRYISFLKESFVIFELSSFSRNLRQELNKSKKYYFWDLGIRNGLTGQFLSLDQRTDTGVLWENFLAIERIKKHEYEKAHKQHFFWRTHAQAEIDWIEVDGNTINAYEFKWKQQKSKTPKIFNETYGTEVITISNENYLSFVK